MKKVILDEKINISLNCKIGSLKSLPKIKGIAPSTYLLLRWRNKHVLDQGFYSLIRTSIFINSLPFLHKIRSILIKVCFQHILIKKYSSRWRKYRTKEIIELGKNNRTARRKVPCRSDWCKWLGQWFRYNI